MTTDTLWRTKLAARLHDPAEKALVLLRDPAGHENGTSRALTRLLGLKEDTPADVPVSETTQATTQVLGKTLRQSMYRCIQKADWWAASADRPQWPMTSILIGQGADERKVLQVAQWAQVRWFNQPILIHPLTGEQLDLKSLKETEYADIKQDSFDHAAGLLARLNRDNGGEPDLRKALLTLWRFGPEIGQHAPETDKSNLGALWSMLPADTRVPDHSIWDHLDLVSAFAGAFAGDSNGEAALLSLSIGPVQSFIAAARSTSDLWAGSHLLSRLSWEAMRPVCEALGPDAILFPRLRGIPQVDLWLRDQMQLPDDFFDGCDWHKGSSDDNPLFSAALPNRFVAVVPADKVQDIADKVQAGVRQWLQDQGVDVVRRLLQAAGFDANEVAHPVPYEQMRKQLDGFPEVHWAAIPFSIIKPRNEARQTDLDLASLKACMAPFYGNNPDMTAGFLQSPAWQVLQNEQYWEDGTTFFAPNPGVLYPVVYELAERALAAAKSAREFDQNPQEGWRCSLSGEAEWLTTDRKLLGRYYGASATIDTLWTRVRKTEPAWAKSGEHLAALPAIKRLWPTIFAEAAGRALARNTSEAPSTSIDRFVVSTHTMALASQIDGWLENNAPLAEGFEAMCAALKPGNVALPRKLVRRHAKNPGLRDAKRILGLLEAARDQETTAEPAPGTDESLATDTLPSYEDAQRLIQRTLGKAGSSTPSLETYYGLIMMDGDHMGAILSGEQGTSTPKCQISYLQSFHPSVRSGFQERASKQPLIKQYGDQARPVSPNRHLAISGALNDFSQTVVRHIVEREYLGRLIYAGGDDVLAMLPVTDMLSAMQRLRYAYSGTTPDDAAIDMSTIARAKRGELHCKNGFACLNGRIMRMMGSEATASCGAVIAHHQAPLGAVLRELRDAEKRAKTEGQRNAFSFTVVKRSGGALYLTAKWGEPMSLLEDCINFLRTSGVSRRAVYHSLEWLVDLPEPTDCPDLLQNLLSWQLAQQAQNRSAKQQAPQLAQRLVALTMEQPTTKPKDWLANFLTVAEFFARDIRSGATS